MTTPQPEKRITPSELPNLFRDYLDKQTHAQAEGKGYPELGNSVSPYEAVPIQPVDPSLAWEEALFAATFFDGVELDEEWKTPPEWASLVNSLEPAVDLACSLGNFPQLVRHVHPLLTASEPAALRKTTSDPIVPELPEWARGLSDPKEKLFAVGVLRLAGHVEEANSLVDEIEGLPESWEPLRANERAALLWHSGQGEEALQAWSTQAESIPVLFNLGMANLFLGNREAAQTSLERVVEQLPETSAWYHLAQLYLTLTR